jgi:hypothetical protein
MIVNLDGLINFAGEEVSTTIRNNISKLFKSHININVKGKEYKVSIYGKDAEGVLFLVKEDTVNTYIKIYRDDFNLETWKDYCRIIGADIECECISIEVASFKEY